MSNVRKVEVVAVRGTCNAALEEGDIFLLEGFRIVPQNNEKACSIAFASIMASIGRLKLQEGPLYISCPDPNTGAGGNVIFKLSMVERHENNHH